MAPTDVDTLLREYIERFESGGSPDPSDFLARVEGTERARLSALIEGYLEVGAPAQEWDRERFEGSVADRAVQRLAERWSAEELAPATGLAAIRRSARIRRDELVGRLADALGVGARREKVAWYYHRLERGLLPSEGVSSKVFEALARLLGTSAEELRAAAGTAPGQASPELGPAYARTTVPGPASVEGGVEAARSPGAVADEQAEPDEVDRLFTAGDS